MHIHKCETKQQRGSSSSSRFHESAVFAWKLPFLATLLCLLFLCAVTYFRTRPMPILQRLQANPAIEKIESWANGSQLSIRAGIDLKNGFNHKSPNLIPYFLPSIIIAPKWREVGLSNYQLHNVSKYVLHMYLCL